ncbi:MAG: DedA family protein [Rubrobacteraceae bacterium]
MGLIEISPSVLLYYGDLALLPALLVGALGVPLPCTLLLLGAGALIHEGTLSLAPVATLALLGAVMGDTGGYLVGRYGGSHVLDRVSRGGRTLDAWRRARGAFDRGGGPAIFFTRFLLTPLAAPTNVIAGGSGYDFRRFLFFDIAGEAVWVGLFVGLGYLFTGSVETLGALASDLSWAVLVAAALALVAYMVVYRTRARLSHQ